MQAVRIDDPARSPRGYMGIVRPGQFVVFAKDGTSGRPTDADGNAITVEAAGGGRLLWVNMGIRETERVRRERLGKLER